MTTQLEEAEGENCNKLRNFSKLLSAITIVLGLLSLVASTFMSCLIVNMDRIGSRREKAEACRVIKRGAPKESAPLLGGGGSDKDD